MAHHVTDQKAEFRVYTAIWIALMILTVVTVAASKIHFGSNAMNLFIAMAIAVVKASLVALFFMHLKHENGAIWTYAVYPMLLIALLMGSVVSDDLIRQPDFVTHPQQDKNWGMEGGHQEAPTNH